MMEAELNRRQFLIGLGAAAVDVLLSKTRRVKAQEVDKREYWGPIIRRYSKTMASKTEEAWLGAVLTLGGEYPFLKLQSQANAVRQAVSDDPRTDGCTVMVPYNGLGSVRFLVRIGNCTTATCVSQELLMHAISVPALAGGIVDLAVGHAING